MIVTWEPTDVSNKIQRAPTVKFEDYFQNLQPGMIMEFGVSGGKSLQKIVALTPNKVYGFDSFKGLPEDWGPHNTGAFKADPPSISGNVELVIGLFQDTLPKFLEEHKDPVSFAHIDCDLYSSHVFVLDQLKDRLRGAVVVFDDIMENPRYEQHGFRAFNEFIEKTGYEWECLGRWQSPSAGFRFY